MTKIEINLMIIIVDLMTEFFINFHNFLIKLTTNHFTHIIIFMTMSMDLFITLFTNAEQIVHQFDDQMLYVGEQVDYSWCYAGHQNVQSMFENVHKIVHQVR